MPLLFSSTNGQAPAVTLREAFLRGLAPDRGLYFPAKFPQLTPEELAAFPALPYADIAFRVLSKFTRDIVPEDELPQTGAEAAGMINASIYSSELKTPANEAFIKAWKTAYGKDDQPDFEAVAAWNAMDGIYTVVRKLGDKATGDAAMAVFKTIKINGPSGPISIDPETRDIIQPVYLAKVQQVDGAWVNVPFTTLPAVKDAWKQLNPAVAAK